MQQAHFGVSSQLTTNFPSVGITLEWVPSAQVHLTSPQPFLVIDNESTFDIDPRGLTKVFFQGICTLTEEYRGWEFGAKSFCCDGKSLRLFIYTHVSEFGKNALVFASPRLTSNIWYSFNLTLSISAFWGIFSQLYYLI